MGKLIAFGWYGGKFSHLGWLLPLLPKTRHFCEPFAGSAAVLLNREPSPVETYNDIDGEVVNFFRVLRDQKETLIEAIGLTPFAREEFELAISQPTPDLTDLERARRFFIRARQVRTGLAQTASSGRWANCLLTSRAGMAGAVSRWLGSVEDLSEIVQRLLRVQIENSLAIDIIKRYDSEETLFYCLPTGSLVRTVDEQLIPIELLCVGNRVAPGQLVKDIISREYNGKLLTFTIQGLPDTLTTTDDHHFIRISKRTGRRQEKRSNELLWSSREIIPARELTIGDYLLVPLGGKQQGIIWQWNNTPRANNAKRREDAFLNPCAELYRFLGYYAAEGHLQRDNGHPTTVLLSFHEKERDTWIADVIHCCQTAFGITPTIRVGPSTSSHVLQVLICSTSIAEFVDHYVHGLAYSKVLDQPLLTAPINGQRELLIGWLRGDGGLGVSSRNRVKLMGSSASEALARQMFLLALRCGLRPSFKRRTRTISLTRRAVYDVYFAAEDAMLLGWEVPCEKFRSSRRIINGHMLVRVKQIEERHYRGCVFDLDVDGDDLFCAPYVLVHNCDPPYPHDCRGDSKAYAYEMTDEGHRQLADVLRNVKGKVALSSYHCDLMDELYSDWHYIEAPIKNCHSIKKPRTEVLWVNYEREEAIECQRQQKSLTPLFNELPLISSNQ